MIKDHSQYTGGKNKYLVRNRTINVNDFYNKYFKTLKKLSKEISRIWKDFPCSYIGRIYIVEKTILSKVICRFNEILTKVLEKK